MSFLRVCRGSQDVYRAVNDGDVVTRKAVIQQEERVSPALYPCLSSVDVWSLLVVTVNTHVMQGCDYYHLWSSLPWESVYKLIPLPLHDLSVPRVRLKD